MILNNPTGSNVNITNKILYRHHNSLNVPVVIVKLQLGATGDDTSG